MELHGLLRLSELDQVVCGSAGGTGRGWGYVGSSLLQCAFLAISLFGFCVYVLRQAYLYWDGIYGLGENVREAVVLCVYLGGGM